MTPQEALAQALREVFVQAELVQAEPDTGDDEAEAAYYRYTAAEILDAPSMQAFVRQAAIGAAVERALEDDRLA